MENQERIWTHDIANCRKYTDTIQITLTEDEISRLEEELKELSAFATNYTEAEHLGVILETDEYRENDKFHREIQRKLRESVSNLKHKRFDISLKDVEVNGIKNERSIALLISKFYTGKYVYSYLDKSWKIKDGISWEHCFRFHEVVANDLTELFVWLSDKQELCIGYLGWDFKYRNPLYKDLEKLIHKAGTKKFISDVVWFLGQML